MLADRNIGQRPDNSRSDAERPVSGHAADLVGIANRAAVCDSERRTAVNNNRPCARKPRDGLYGIGNLDSRAFGDGEHGGSG